MSSACSRVWPSGRTGVCARNARRPERRTSVMNTKAGRWFLPPRSRSVETMRLKMGRPCQQFLTTMALRREPGAGSGLGRWAGPAGAPGPGTQPRSPGQQRDPLVVSLGAAEQLPAPQSLDVRHVVPVPSALNQGLQSLDGGAGGTGSDRRSPLSPRPLPRPQPARGRPVAGQPWRHRPREPCGPQGWPAVVGARRGPSHGCGLRGPPLYDPPGPRIAAAAWRAF